MSEPTVASSSQSAPLDPYWQVRTGHCRFRNVDISSLSKATGVSGRAIIPLEHQSDILNPSFKASQTRQTPPAVLLERIESLAPSIAMNYYVKPTRTQNIQLRFLWPDLREGHNLQAFQSYIALSYCWPTPKSNVASSAWKRTKTLLNISDRHRRKESQQLPFPVSPVIFKAVLDECQSPGEGLWVDQLCIIQEDEEEKEVTISAMDAIYKSARLVVVALQDIEVSEAEEAKLRKYIPIFEDARESLDMSPEINNLVTQNLMPLIRSIPSSQRGMAVQKMSRVYEQSLRRIQPTELRRLVEAGEMSPERAREIHEGIQRNIPQFVESFSGLLGMPTEVSSALKAFAQKILRSKWFTRAWCAHEAEMSDRHVFLIKCRSDARRVLRFTGSFLLHLMMKFQNDSLSPRSRQHVDLDGYIFHVLRLHSRYLGEEIGDENAPTWIRSCRFVLALHAGGDPKLEGLERAKDAIKDKLSIVLNTMNTGLYCRGLRLTEDECYYHLIIVGLAARDPTTLLTNGRHLRLTEDKKILSWMQAPTMQETSQASQQLLQTAIPRFPATNIALDPGTGCQWISLDMAFFRSQNYEDYATDLLVLDNWWVQLARWFIALSWRLGFDPLHPEASLPRRLRPPSGSREILDNPLWRTLLETLTGCLMWGIPWVTSIDAAEQFPGLESDLESIHECQRRDGDPTEVLSAFENIMGFLLHLVLTGTQDARRLANSTPYFLTTFGIGNVKHRVICYGPRKASGPVQVTIPVCLLSEDYKDFNRVWLLTRRDEPNEGWQSAWNMLGKVRMIGQVVGLCSDDEKWQTLRNERVYASRESVEGRR